MREDQFRRLTDLSEKLTETVLRDADPDNWIGHGKTAAEMSKDERGDAVWCRKLAVQSLTVLGRVQHLLQNERDRGGRAPEEPDPEEEIRRAEQEAARLLERVIDGHRPHR